MMSAAQRSVIALRYSRSLSRALLAKARGDRNFPTQVRFNIGDQIFYYRGLNKTNLNGLRYGTDLLSLLALRATTHGFRIAPPS